MTTRSLRLLNLSPSEHEAFAKAHKDAHLKRQVYFCLLFCECCSHCRFQPCDCDVVCFVEQTQSAFKFCYGHVSIMWFMVCHWPQSQEDDWVRPHFVQVITTWVLISISKTCLLLALCTRRRLAEPLKFMCERFARITEYLATYFSTTLFQMVLCTFLFRHTGNISMV